MPRYRQRKKGSANFGKAFPETTNVAHWTTFCSRLKPAELESLQEIARHYNGKKTRYRGVVPPKPDRKILRGVWDDIEGAQHGAELAAGIVHEHQQHETDPDFHKGGGLWSGLMSLADTAWNYATSYVKPLGWVQSAVDWTMGYKHDSDIPAETKQRVDLIAEAKKAPGTRQGTVHGWTLDEDASSGRVAVYVDQGSKEVHAVVRGTSVTNATDLIEDAKIIFNGSPDSEEVRETLINVAKKYEGFDLDALGYSLGGSQVTEAFSESDPDKKEWLDKYGNISLVNPGASPFNGEDKIKALLGQERTTLLVNRSDIISSLYTQNAYADRTYYGPHTYQPLHAHSNEQFSTTPPDWSTSAEQKSASAGMD